VLRRVSPTGELILVNLICFGPFAAMSLTGLAARETSFVFDDRRLYTIAAIEIVCGLLATYILRARGWKASDLGLRVSMPLTIAGMILFVGANIVIATGYELFRVASGTDPAAMTTPVIRTTWPALLVLLAIDPLYEEVFEVAYNVKALEGHGAALAVTFSAMVRFVCHLYQGPISAITILPLGIIFAAVYWKWRRVWPLVIAHGAAGFFAFAPQGG
jgi:membrane protease YdiL (CAAX protease family)